MSCQVFGGESSKGDGHLGHWSRAERELVRNSRNRRRGITSGTLRGEHRCGGTTFMVTKGGNFHVLRHSGTEHNHSVPPPNSYISTNKGKIKSALQV